MYIFAHVIEQTGASLKLNLITQTRQQLGVLDEAEFRRWLSNPRSLSRANQERLRSSILNLRFELSTLEHIHLSTQHFRQPLSALDKEELFKKARRLIGKNDNFDKQIRTSIPRVQTHRVERPGPALPRVPEVLPTRNPHINVVKLDDLARTQKKLLPAPATAKLEEIIQDIQAGRLSRKRRGNYTYVDLPQVEAGSGRGLWRVAIEQNGKDGGKNVYIIRGIFDYHASKHVAWGV
ncbi:hypothetical protein [Pseudomonas orientalis]|uniref:hypothetical protein n=1 Tax=Pseudomonas orientalis TaxID=76758 RepID=UPI002FE0A811